MFLPYEPTERLCKISDVVLPKICRELPCHTPITFQDASSTNAADLIALGNMFLARAFLERGDLAEASAFIDKVVSLEYKPILLSPKFYPLCSWMDYLHKAQFGKSKASISQLLLAAMD